MDVKTYVVGGYVRDKILGIESNDIDYAVEANSFDEMVTYVETLPDFVRFFEVKPEYNTVRAKIGNDGVDYVLCRKDGLYTDGRRPDSVENGTLFDDLSRRDFTMNAIAIDEHGRYIDPFNGLEDINDGIIQCVGNVEDRMSEDALRLLRAIRFSVTKSMMLSPEIQVLLTDGAFISLLCNVPEDRIRQELLKMFSYNTRATLWAFRRYELLSDFIFSETNIWLKPTVEKK